MLDPLQAPCGDIEEEEENAEPSRDLSLPDEGKLPEPFELTDAVALDRSLQSVSVIRVLREPFLQFRLKVIRRF